MQDGDFMHPSLKPQQKKKGPTRGRWAVLACDFKAGTKKGETDLTPRKSELRFEMIFEMSMLDLGWQREPLVDRTLWEQ